MEALWRRLAAGNVTVVSYVSWSVETTVTLPAAKWRQSASTSRLGRIGGLILALPTRREDVALFVQDQIMDAGFDRRIEPLAPISSSAEGRRPRPTKSSVRHAREQPVWAPGVRCNDRSLHPLFDPGRRARRTQGSSVRPRSILPRMPERSLFGGQRERCPHRPADVVGGDDRDVARRQMAPERLHFAPWPDRGV